MRNHLKCYNFASMQNLSNIKLCNAVEISMPTSRADADPAPAGHAVSAWTPPVLQPWALGLFSSKIDKKRTWSFPVLISRWSERKYINEIRKHVHAYICSVVLLLPIFNNMQMVLLCSNFFCSCCSNSSNLSFISSCEYLYAITC